MNSAFCNTCHFSSFTNFDSSIFSYQTFDNETIFISVREPCLLLCFSGTSFSAVWPSLNLLHHADTSFQLKPGHKCLLTCDESCSDSCLQKSVHPTELKVGIIFSPTGHFVHLYSVDTWMVNNDTSAATSPLPDIPIYASDIGISRTGHV
jgi:hypothetical protein